MLTNGVAGSSLDGVSIPVFFENVGIDVLMGATSGVSEPFLFLEAVLDTCTYMLVIYRNSKVLQKL